MVLAWSLPLKPLAIGGACFTASRLPLLLCHQENIKLGNNCSVFRLKSIKARGLLVETCSLLVETCSLLAEECLDVAREHRERGANINGGIDPFTQRPIRCRLVCRKTSGMRVHYRTLRRAVEPAARALATIRNRFHWRGWFG